jgi:hypothetical protein
VTTTFNIPDATSADSGWYRLLVAEEGNINSPHCRIASQAIPLHVWSSRPFAITSNSPVCEGSDLQLTAPPALGYQWTGPDGFTSTQDSLVFNPVSVNRQGAYKLILTTQGGCTSEAQKTVFVQADDLKVSIRRDSVFCQGTSVTLNAANTDDHDFDFKSKHAEKFLKDGNKVKAYVQFRGRAIVFKDRGELLLLKFAERLAEFGQLESMPKMEGKRMLAIFAPKVAVKKK